MRWLMARANMILEREILPKTTPTMREPSRRVFGAGKDSSIIVRHPV